MNRSAKFQGMKISSDATNMNKLVFFMHPVSVICVACPIIQLMARIVPSCSCCMSGSFFNRHVIPWRRGGKCFLYFLLFHRLFVRAFQVLCDTIWLLSRYPPPPSSNNTWMDIVMKILTNISVLISHVMSKGFKWSWSVLRNVKIQQLCSIPPLIGRV